MGWLSAIPPSRSKITAFSILAAADGLHRGSTHRNASLSARAHHALADRGKNGVRSAEMRVLHMLHILRRHDQAKLAQFFHAPAVKACQHHRRRSSLARRLKPKHHIFRIAATGNRKRQIALLHQAAKLLRKNMLVAGIVSPSGHQRNIISERHHPQPRALSSNSSLPNISSQMRSQRRASAVPENKKRPTLLVTAPNRLRKTIHHHMIKPLKNPPQLINIIPRRQKPRRSSRNRLPVFPHGCLSVNPLIFPRYTSNAARAIRNCAESTLKVFQLPF